MKNQHSPPSDQRRPERNERRPYKAPTLVEYGPIGKLTQFFTSGSLADFFGTMRRSCL